ncbi:hypothetical protein BJV74DRAFT_889106 [Russula compacta]|nr:hypothetical protein BJV74DRAFT_889106 [Russula compacta]
MPVPKTRKPKKRKEEKSRQRKAVSSSDADAATVETTPAARGEENEDLGRGAVDEQPYAPTPPTGGSTASITFDYDAVKADDGAELWLVRAPTAVKARNLRGLEISSSSQMGLVRGDLLLRKRGGATYDLWALEPTAAAGGGASAHASGNGGGDDDRDEFGGTVAAAADVCAEELSSLSVLLPCKRKGGKVYLAQKPVTRHLVVAACPAKPTTQPDAASDSAAAYQNPEREAYPEEVLTHRFRPYGDPGDLPPVDHADVEVAAEASTTKEKEKSQRKGGETGSAKKKKAKLVAS